MQRQVVTGFLSAFAVIGAGCRPMQPPLREARRSAVADPENHCPNQRGDIVLRADSDGTRRILSIMPIAENLTDSREYHDCQKFVDPDGADYGPLVGIWAAKDLDLLFPNPLPTTPAVNATLVAQIYNWGTPYNPLKIATDFNCLYLWFDGRDWKASMASAGMDPNGCARSIAVPAGPTGLVVSAPSNEGFDPADIPAVARWDRSADDREQYIGIRCGPSWCEIGSSKFHPSLAHARAYMSFPPMPGHPSQSPSKDPRAWMLKGWYDEQHLAVLKPSGIGVRPHEVVGTLVPHPQLGELNSRSDFANRWMPSAQASLSGRSTEYEKKNRLALFKGVNLISLCRQDKPGGCPPEAGHVLPTNCPSDGTGTWYAEVSSLRGKIFNYYCVTREDHGADPTVATARWHWLNNDETIWIRCLNGCCTLS